MNLVKLAREGTYIQLRDAARQLESSDPGRVRDVGYALQGVGDTSRADGVLSKATAASLRTAGDLLTADIGSTGAVQHGGIQTAHAAIGDALVDLHVGRPTQIRLNLQLSIANAMSALTGH